MLTERLNQTTGSMLTRFFFASVMINMEVQIFEVQVLPVPCWKYVQKSPSNLQL